MSLPTLGEVIYGMKRLTSSDHQAKSDVSHKTDPKAVLDLDFLLRNNLEAFDEALINDGKLVNLSRWWREVVLFETGGVSSVRRRFVTYCLKLLHCLHRTIQRCQSEQEAARTDRQDGSGTGQCNSSNLAAPALGVQDQKTLKSVLQFIVCLGISPYLQTGVGIPLHMRSGFSAIVGKEADLPYTDASCLPSCLKVLLQCTDMSSLATVILSQHLTDLLAGLLQVLHTKQCEKRGDKAKYDIRPESEVQVSHEDTKNIKSGSVTVEAVEISEKCEGLSMKTVHDGSSVSKRSTTETLDSDERNESVEMPDLDAEYCRKSLQNLFNRVYPPLLVKTLLLLQGGPKLKRPASNKVPVLPPAPVWMRHVINETSNKVPVLPPAPVWMRHVLNETSNKVPVLPPAPVWMRHVLNQQLATIMMKPKGIQYVLRGMMDGPGASTGINTGTADWKRCDAVARVITCCPLQYITLGDFYTAIGPQIRDLLHLEDKQMCQQYIRIAWSAISNMAQQDLALTKQHVISPILQPLISCTTDNQDVSHSSIHVTEASLSCCIEDCYKVFVCGCTDNPSLITCLQEIILPVYDLLVFTKPGVSTLKKQCHEIVVSFLKQVENDAGINFLEFMAFQESTQDARLDLPIMHPGLVFQHGPNGGVQVVVSRGDGKKDQMMRRHV